MDKFRMFEKLRDEARLPERATKYSAGYDFYAAETVTIPANKIVTVWTGVRAWMPEDEVLLLYNRSSNPIKRKLILSNGVGVVDSDYYGNKDNGGDIGFAFYNAGDLPVVISKGDKLGQGIFQKYLLAVNDVCGGERTGGYGSTDKQEKTI